MPLLSTIFGETTRKNRTMMRAVPRVLIAVCAFLSFWLVRPAYGQVINPPQEFDEYLVSFETSSTPITVFLDALIVHPDRTESLISSAVQNSIIGRFPSSTDYDQISEHARKGNRAALSAVLIKGGYFAEGETTTAKLSSASPTPPSTTGGGTGLILAGAGAAVAGGALLYLNQRSGGGSSDPGQTNPGNGDGGSSVDADGDGTVAGLDPDDGNACNPNPNANGCVGVDTDNDGYFSNHPTNSGTYDPNDSDPCAPNTQAAGCDSNGPPDMGANPRNISVGAQGPLINRTTLQNSAEYTGAGLQDIAPTYVPTPFTLAVKADYALANGWTGEGVKIAFFDDEIDGTHIEFSNFEDGGGTVDCSGCSNYFTHGTHVAGVAAADYGDGGMTGIAPDATVYGVTLFDDFGNGTIVLDDYEALVNQAVADDVRIFNNSWGGSLDNMIGLNDTAAVWEAAQDAGAVFIWARGNDHLTDPDGSDYALVPVDYPELADQWVTVTNVVESIPGNGDWVISNIDGGTTINGTFYQADANECGAAAQWCISAPGTFVYSSVRDHPDPNDPSTNTDANGADYTYGSGTSVSAPVVSGAFAVLFQAFPYLETSTLVDLIFHTADDLGDAGVDEVYGHGLLNLEEALKFQGNIPVIASTSSVSGGGLDATASGIETSNSDVAEGFAAAMNGIVVLDDFGRAYQLNTDLFIQETNEIETQSSTETGTGSTLGHIDLASRRATLGDSTHLSAHFRAVTQGLFFSAALGNATEVTAGFGLDGQYGAAIARNVSRTRFEAGAVYDQKEGRLPTLQTSGAFAAGSSALTGYVRASTDQRLSRTVSAGGSAEIGLTRPLGRVDQSLLLRAGPILTGALSAHLTRHFDDKSLTGTVSLPVSILSGEITYLVPTGRTIDDGIEQEERTWSLQSLADSTLGLAYDWGGGSVGVSATLDFGNVKGSISVNF